MKLSKAQRRILRVIAERATDVHDIADAVRLNVSGVVNACDKLQEQGLVEWMYPEDEVAISTAGRAALKDTTHAE